jgi:hypothetical protein
MLGKSSMPRPLAKTGHKTAASLAKPMPRVQGARSGKHPGPLAKGMPGVHKITKSPYSC